MDKLKEIVLLEVYVWLGVFSTLHAVKKKYFMIYCVLPEPLRQDPERVQHDHPHLRIKVIGKTKMRIVRKYRSPNTVWGLVLVC